MAESLRIVRQGPPQPTITQRLDAEKRQRLRIEAESVLKTYGDRLIAKSPLNEQEGDILRRAQAAGVLPENLPPTSVNVQYGGRVRVETFAGRNHEGTVWQQFAGKNLTVGKFLRPDMQAIAANQERAKGWWQP